MPDYVVSVLKAPTTAVPGQIIDVNDTTKNQGGGSIASTTTRFYLSTDTKFSADDIPLQGRVVRPLGFGESSPGSTSVTISSDTPPKKYYLIAVADNGKAVDEGSKETNNTKYRAITIKPLL
ncbi:MAG: hypothetical protein HY695_16220 [Deltaproteobacteria bacterium]|nr:hypothetical protein [Deltaproteobacteria bacterium]